MTNLSTNDRIEQDRVNQWIRDEFAQHRRFELDARNEAILWLHSPPELVEVVRALQNHKQTLFDRLSDLTAYDNVDGKDGTERFVSVTQLYSTKFHTRLRIKCLVGEKGHVPTLTSIWKMANWLERECFDMFGIVYSGHPDLRRILMDERFDGFPLRKEYPLDARQQFSDTLGIRIMGQNPHGEKP